MSYGNGSEADWRSYSDAYNPSDGLIDPGRIPKIPIDVGAMQAAGSRIKSAGIKVHGAGASVDRTWQQLGHSYRAPETPQLLSGSSLVVRKADGVQSRLNTIGDAVWHFAAEMQGLNAQLDGLRAQATTFVAWARARGPAAWPEASYQTGGLGHMPGRDYNDLLAKKVAGVLSHVRQIEQEYAGQIGTAFDTTFDPPPGKPRPFHSRTEAEDAHAAVPSNWRDLDLAGVALPWGGSKSDAVDQFVDGIGDSVLSTVLALPGLVGLGLNQSGRFGWSLGTLKNSWLGLGRMSMATNPLTWAAPSQAAANWKTMATAFNGLIGKDANGNWGPRGAGRLVGNVGALLIPGADDLAVGAMADKGAAMAERGGMWGAAGRAMQAPKWITTGGWAGLDVRAVRAGFDDSTLLGRALRAPGNGWHLPSVPEGEVATRAGHRAMPHVPGLDRQPERDFDADLSRVTAAHASAADAAHDAASAKLTAHGQDAARQRDLIWEKAKADAAGKPAAEQTRIFKDATQQIKQLSDHTSRITSALGRDSDNRFSALDNRFYDDLDALRGNAGLPPVPGHHPIALPDAEQSIRDRLMAAGLNEHAATAGAHELQDLSRAQKPLADWTADQKALLASYLRDGPQVTPDTELSKVLGPKEVQDFLANHKGTVGGFVTQDPFVRDAVRPVDRVDALALDYHFRQEWARQESLRQKAYWLTHRGHAQPFGPPLHGYGEVVFRTHPDDLDRYVIPVSGHTESALKDSGADLTGAHLKVHDAPAPYTGVGLTGGGVPEYIATGARISDGTMYWYQPTRDGGVTRFALGTFHDGKWYANPGVAEEHLKVGVNGQPASGRYPWSTTTRDAWSQLPEGLREWVSGDFAWDLGTSQPAPPNPPQHHNDPLSDYTEVPTG
ncbi:hypothetical protein [Rugosimonospora africana]|uniref:Uncharacterized protein n=1 Tax=Rugosimonospora africana TaxID=556532 RepID=A0A8J3QVL6_9ACTN|nr:hypothetical protein [Rugosimonospora africana]GIH17658.1 hypothetical protein Raf01_58300 [Rugosimonospora africana]